jgi:hypothetical protein
MQSTAAILQRLTAANDSEYKVNTPKIGVTVYNEPYYWNPIDNGSYSARSNNRIRIDIPNTEIWNFQNAWLAADLAVTSDGISTDANPAYVRMSNGSWNAFERVRHLSNLSPIEEIYPYWSLYTYQWVFEQSEQVEQTFTEILGIGTQNARDLWAMNGGPATGGNTKRFIFPIDLGWLSSGPFPAKYLNTTQSIEIVLTQPNQFLESNCSNLNFTLSNIELHAYKMSAKFPNLVNEFRGTTWEDGFRAFIRSGNYSVMLDYFDWYQNTPIAIQGDYLIPVKTSAIQGIYTVFGNVNNISNPLINDRIMDFPKLDLEQYQFKIFSKMYPEQPVDCRNEAFQAYQFYVNLVNGWTFNAFPGLDPTNDSMNEVPVTLSNFNSDSFVAVADFRSIRKVPSINPIFNADASTGEIRLNLRFNSSPPTGTCTYHIVRSSSIFGCTAEGTPWVALN